MTTQEIIISQIQSAGGRLPYRDLVLGFPVQSPAQELTAAIASLEQAGRLEYQQADLVLVGVL
jgi:hypothetical protein